MKKEWKKCPKCEVNCLMTSEDTTNSTKKNILALTVTTSLKTRFKFTAPMSK